MALKNKLVQAEAKTRREFSPNSESSSRSDLEFLLTLGESRVMIKFLPEFDFSKRLSVPVGK